MAGDDVPEPNHVSDYPQIGQPHWPPQSESAHGGMALTEIQNAITAHDMSRASTLLSQLVSTDLIGQSGTAFTHWFDTQGKQLMESGQLHFNQWAGLSLMAQNILNTKLGLTGISEKFQADWEALQAQAIAEGWTQQEFDEARQNLLNRAKQESQELGDNFKTAHSELNNGVKTGSPASVPASMPSTPEGSPSVPGSGGDMGSLASMVPQMFSPLTQGMGAFNPQQLASTVMPLANQLGAANGQNGVPVTREALNTMIKGQGGNPLGEQRGSLSAPKIPGAKDDERNGPGGPAKQVKNRPTMDPEEAARLAAPPETEAVSAVGGDEIGVQAASAGADGAHQHNTLETHPASGGAAGAAGSAVAPPTGAVAGGMAGGGGMGMMPPMMMAPQAGGGGAGGGLPQRKTTEGERVEADPLGDADRDEKDARMSYLASDASDTGIRGVSDSRAVRVMSALQQAHRSVGVSTALAVADIGPSDAFPDGRVVFATSDGLGFLPFGVSVPKSTPLGSLPLPDGFRIDWLGCKKPERAITAAVEAGIIDKPELVVTTDQDTDESAVFVDQDTVSAALAEHCSVSRVDLPKAQPHRIAEAISTFSQAWAADPNMPLTVAEARCWGRRWDYQPDPEYRKAFAQYLVSDAQFCLSRGDVDAAAFAVWHLVNLPL